MEDQFSGNSQRRKYCFTKKSPYQEFKIKKHLARIFYCEPLNDRDREEFFNLDNEPGFAR